MLFSGSGLFSRSKTLLALSFVASLALASCAEFAKVDENYQASGREADRALQQLSPKSALAQPLTVDKRPYYGSAAVPISNGSTLPTQYEQPGALVMTFARPVTMSELARMIQAVTGLRAMASGASITPGGGGGGETEQTFIPADGEQVAGGRVVWQGRLSELLNQASDAFGADWRYDGTTILFARSITRTFMLHALASELSYKGSVKSGSTGDAASNLPEVDVTSTSSMKVWEEIKESVATIMGESGKAAFSPSTGTITVSGAPDMVRRVESYLNQQNSMRLRRVAVAIKVLSITASNQLDLASDVKGLIEKAFDNASLRSVGSATSGVTIGILKAPDADATSADNLDIQEDRIKTGFRADKRIERVSVVHSGALVTLSDQPAPLQVGKQISYLKRTSTTSGDSGGSVSLEPGTINTGLMMTVLPRIVEQNQILMRMSLAITDVAQIVDFESGGTTIQLPEVDTTGFLQNAVMTSGETLVLAGFEKNLNSAIGDGAPDDAWVLGGSRGTQRSREMIVMLVTAEVLPEDPITVIGE